MTEIPYGYCQCGCGNKTKLAKQTDSKRGNKKGEPVKFIKGHRPSRKDSHRIKEGYITIRTDFNKYRPEHIVIAEKILGKALPVNAIIHHVNLNPSDNRPENLVICQDNSYHMLLHRRLRAFKACGHADWRKCRFCKKYEAQENLVNYGGKFYHKICGVNDRRNRRIKKRESQRCPSLQLGTAVSPEREPRTMYQRPGAGGSLTS